jgi:hypothetical protein
MSCPHLKKKHHGACNVIHISCDKVFRSIFLADLRGLQVSELPGPPLTKGSLQTDRDSFMVVIFAGNYPRLYGPILQVADGLPARTDGA